MIYSIAKIKLGKVWLIWEKMVLISGIAGILNLQKVSKTMNGYQFISLSSIYVFIVKFAQIKGTKNSKEDGPHLREQSWFG